MNDCENMKHCYLVYIQIYQKEFTFCDNK